MSLQYKKIEKMVKGFANHRRIQILELVKIKPGLTVDKIAESLNVNFMTVSDHIRKLSDAGLVSKQKKGKYVVHTLTKQGNNILSFCKMLF